jgi:hypothetical protein
MLLLWKHFQSMTPFALIRPRVLSVCARLPLFAPLLLFLLPLPLHTHAPLRCLCLFILRARLRSFDLACLRFEPIHAHLTLRALLFAPAAAIPAVVAAAHTCALALALGLCVPALCVSSVVVPYL